MSLGAVRMRPKANRPSITNQSAVPGGLFGREPAYNSQPPQRGGDGGLDFLNRLEAAEGRDTDRQRHGAMKRQQAYGRRTQDGGFTDTAWAFGDDSSPQHAAAPSRYVTSNSATNTHMQQVHEDAIQRHHENTIRDLLREHGLGEAEVEHELDKWRREVASGKAAPVPTEQPANPVALRGARGENGNFLQQAAFEDPFKQRATSGATPPRSSKPWEIDDAFKQRAATPTRSSNKPWEIDDAFKRRSGAAGVSPPRSRTAAWDVQDPLRTRPDSAAVGYDERLFDRGAAGAQRAGAFAPPDARMHMGGMQMGGRDPNASSVPGGIFA